MNTSAPRRGRFVGQLVRAGLATLLALLAGQPAWGQSAALFPFAQAQPQPPELFPKPQPGPPVLPGTPGPLPPPLPLPPDPFGPDGQGLSPRACEPQRPAVTPRPGKQEQEQFSRFLDKRIEPGSTLELILNRQTVLIFKQPVKRVQLPDLRIADYLLLDPRELSITGKLVGSTVLNLWFADPADPKKEVILSYLVRVRPVPGSREDPQTRLRRIYADLEKQINCAFPNSLIHLNLVGSRIVLSGMAKDRPEADAILSLVLGNSRGRRNTLPLSGVNVNLNLLGQDLVNDPTRTGSLQRLLQAQAPRILNLLRVPGEQQVLLRVTVAEVNRIAARSIGVNFSIFNKFGVPVFSQLTGNIGGGSVGGGGGTNGTGGSSGSGGGSGGLGSSLNNLPTILDNGRIVAAIDALRNLNFARSLAEPTLVALQGQTASFQAGGTFPVPVVTGTTLTGLQGVQFIPFGVQVSFRPFISDKDRIRLTVQANVSTRNISTGTSIGGAAVPGTNTRNFQTTVELREGQTMAVAGLIQNDFGANASRVPFFGDLPLVGRLFALDATSAGEQELVILITPELVHPLDPKECPPLPGADLFEPGDIEFYLLGRLESRRPYDYRSPAMTDLARMARYRHCEQIFIFGPQGHSDSKP